MVTFNGIDRLIEVTDNTVFSLDVEKDIYSAWKDWSLLSDNSKYAPALRTFGGDPTVTSQFAPKYFFLQNFWRVSVDNGNVVSVGLNLYSEDYDTPYVVVAGSGVSDRNSDAVNVNQEAINAQSFTNDAVSIDTINGLPGTLFPKGTPTDPSSNFIDAKTIADSRNLKKYNIRGAVTLSNGPLLGCVFESTGAHAIEDVDLNGVDVTDCSFHNLVVAGTQVGSGVVYNGCAMMDVVDFDGILVECGIKNTLNFANGTSSVIHSTHSIGPCDLVFNGATASDVRVTAYDGDIELQGMSNALDVFEIDFNSGRFEIDSTCTDGNIIVRGTCELIDNSGPGCTVTRSGTVTDLVWNAQTSEYQIAGSTGEAVSSGGALTVDQSTQLKELWQLLGLDIANPLLITATLDKQTGTIDLEATCNPDGSVSVERQP